MDDQMCTEGSTSGSCIEANVPCPIPQDVDPFQLPFNLTPALRRAKSRAKLPAKRSVCTQSLSKVEGCSDVFLEKGVAKRVNGVVARVKSSATVAKIVPRQIAAQTPTRARKCIYPISLSPKKPRLFSASMSCSDLRPARKSVMVEVDHEPPPCTTPSRLSRALRYNSVNFSANFGRNVDAEVSAESDPAKSIVLPDRSPRMFFSRSSMCLRLTPDRGMREQRRSGAKILSLLTPLDNLKKELQHSRTVSDLQRMSEVLVKRGRRISLSDTNLKNTWLTQDVTKHTDDKQSASDSKRGEGGDVRSAVIKDIDGNAIYSEATASNSEMVVHNDDQNTFVHLTTVTTPLSEKHASEPTVDPSSYVEADVEKEKETNKRLFGEGEEEVLLITLLPSDMEEGVEAQQDSKETSFFYPKDGSGESVMSSDSPKQSEDFKGVEILPEQDKCRQEVSTICLCSIEASSSTSACLTGNVSDVPYFVEEPKDSSTSIQASKSSASQTARTKLSPKKRVNFRSVTVYYFARTQGMSTVPKSGEVSLGMVDKHFTKRQFPLYYGRRPELTLPDHEEEDLSKGEIVGDVYDPEGLERCTAYQLPLFEVKARIKLLKKSGVQVQKDTVESLDSIRQSRILCGCQCERMCKAETCQCALDGICCQVDGPDESGNSHPCYCITENCLNPFGRVEFDPEHVKNHYRVTMMRLHHAEQKGIYDSPQRVRFNSEGEPQQVSHFTPFRGITANASILYDHESLSVAGSDNFSTRKFPVTPVYRKSKQKRGQRVQLAGYPKTSPC